MKTLKLFENFIILIFFFFKSCEIFESLKKKLAKSNFCAIQKHIALSCHVISFIDFARELENGMSLYCFWPIEKQ